MLKDHEFMMEGSSLRVYVGLFILCFPAMWCTFFRLMSIRFRFLASRKYEFVGGMVCLLSIISGDELGLDHDEY